MNVVIDVEDVQDDPPEFLYTPLSMVIYENVDVVSTKCVKSRKLYKSNWYI